MIDKSPTPDQIAAAHAFGEAVLRLLMAVRHEEPKPEKVVPISPAQAGGAPASAAEPERTEPLLIGIREAARLLGISERTLHGLTAPRGPVPSVRFGSSVRYSLEDLREWIRKQRTQRGGGH